MAFIFSQGEDHMFRGMRRKKQVLSAGEIDEILSRGTSGVLALSGDDGYPYAVPISYAYDGKKLYFHCAKAGHKLDAVRRNSKASFCVIDRDQILPEKYTICFRSVIAFGSIRVIEDDDEKMAAIEKFALRYAPMDSAANRRAEIDREWDILCMMEMTIEHITGKEAMELVKKRKQ